MLKIINYKDNKLFFIQNLQVFLQKNLKMLSSFRYYNNRQFDVLENHIYSALYFDDEICVGYGHLDAENKKVWLGIIVSEEKQKIGVGQYIMDDLLFKFDGNIYLTVDLTNERAIKLYKKKGFSMLEENNKHILMIRKKWDIL